MKLLHRADCYGWSQFDQTRNLDFNSVLWVRPEGNVVVDPLPLSVHDEKHLLALGGAKHLVITNSDHVRDSARLRALTGAQLYGPAAERATFPLDCDVWLEDGAELVPGLLALTLGGSKTAGELVLVLEETTLITGDLVRAHAAGKLDLLPDAKLSNRGEALTALRKLLAYRKLDAVLTGDGWPVFRHGYAALEELAGRYGALPAAS